jgi:hypothetical protein
VVCSISSADILRFNVSSFKSVSAVSSETLCQYYVTMDTTDETVTNPKVRKTGLEKCSLIASSREE